MAHISLMKTVTRRYTPLSHSDVRIDDAFWAPRQRTNREQTLPHIYEQCQRTGRIDALKGMWQPDVVERGHKGSNITILFWDSDVAKWLEAACYSLATHPDSHLDALLDDVIDCIARTQQLDGYFNSWFGIIEPEKRWTNLRDWHEMYNAGHLIEAAVAHFEVTGKRTLLDIVSRYADYIASVFGTEPGKRRGYCGHPEIELALVRLFHATNEQRYLDLARYFVDERGNQPHYYDQESRARNEQPAASYEYSQSHCPVRHQDEVVGHAVRAAYLYSAMADLAAEDDDVSLFTTCQGLWRHLTTKRMYVMGGIGTSKHNEGFTSDYDLPNESAYAETCAGIALVFWAQRMLQIECNRRYSDMMELALYNAVLSGVSLDGTHFFYDNPLASDGTHHRQAWFGCPCCPPNLARVVAALGSYVYAQSDNEAVIHMYVQGQAQFTFQNQHVTLRQETNYPWDGNISVHVHVDTPMLFGVKLRVPEWATTPALHVNHEIIELSSVMQDGYATINREWQDGDTIMLELPMLAERVYAHPAVRADIGSVALRRGPLVYCFEQVDHETPLHRVLLPAHSKLEARFDANLLGGVVVLEAEGAALSDQDWDDTLYRTTPPAMQPSLVRAIPYYAWDQRDAGAMTVWIREQANR